VLSCLPASLFGPVGAQDADAPFALRVAHSLGGRCVDGRRDDVCAWLARLRCRYQMDARKVPLRAVAGWRVHGGVLAHESGRFFEIIGVSVDAPTREVPRWNQPLVRGIGRGIIGLLCQQRGGVLQFLVRGVLEPGDPTVRVGPTLQCIPHNRSTWPPFLTDVVEAPGDQVRLRTVQSEEGGRFFRDERDCVVVELPPETSCDVPPEYMWMTLGEIKELIACDGTVNIELRSLVACLPAAPLAR
jgi:oxidase EvaA